MQGLVLAIRLCNDGDWGKERALGHHAVLSCLLVSASRAALSW